MDANKLSDFERDVLSKLGYLTNMTEMIYEKLGLPYDKEAMDGMTRRIQSNNHAPFAMPKKAEAANE